MYNKIDETIINWFDLIFPRSLFNYQIYIMKSILHLILFLSFSFGQKGLLPITNYSRVDYHASDQNWDITQDNEGLIYIANNECILIYNGYVLIYSRYIFIYNRYVVIYNRYVIIYNRYVHIYKRYLLIYS